MKNFIDRIKAGIASLWNRVSPAWQERIISAWHTFVTVFISVAIVTFQNGQIEWTWAFWGSIVSVAFRMAWKQAWQSIMPPVLGGIKTE